MFQRIQKDKKEGNLIERTYINEEIRDYTDIFIYTYSITKQGVNIFLNIIA